jgi:hypothetical protein
VKEKRRDVSPQDIKPQVDQEPDLFKRRSLSSEGVITEEKEGM